MDQLAIKTGNVAVRALACDTVGPGENQARWKQRVPVVITTRKASAFLSIPSRVVVEVVTGNALQIDYAVCNGVNAEAYIAQ